MLHQSLTNVLFDFDFCRVKLNFMNIRYYQRQMSGLV